MLTWNYTSALGLGLVAACIPWLLHLFRPQPPDRRPLPTVRFLTPLNRSKVRLTSRLDRPWLMLTRSIILLLLGAVFAGLSIHPPRSGFEHVVLVDRTADRPMALETVETLELEGIRAATEAMNQALGSEVSVTVVEFPPTDMASRGPRFGGVGAGGTGVSGIPAEGSESYGPMVQPGYGDVFRELRGALTSRVRADSVSVSFVRVSGLSAGVRLDESMGLVRETLWPGRVNLVLISPDSAEVLVPRSTSPGIARVIAGEGEGRFVEAALESIGWRLSTGEPLMGSVDGLALPPETEPADFTVLRGGESTFGGFEQLPSGWEDIVAEGGTILIEGDGRSGSPDARPSTLFLHSGDDVSGFMRGSFDRLARAIPGEGGGRVVWQDGHPAYATQMLNDRCVVVFHGPLFSGSQLYDPGFPGLLQDLWDPCELRTRRIKADFDLGTVHAIERPDLPLVVEVASLSGQGGGVDLTLSLMIVAALLLIAEGRLRRSGDMRPGDMRPSDTRSTGEHL